MKLNGSSPEQDAGAGSHRAANSRHWHPRFRVEIIGRRARGFWPHIATATRDRCVRQLLVLLHQPSRQQGGGSFFEPDVEQLNDLLTSIGGVTQTRQLVRLQRRARSREKEIPRRLHLGMAVHRALLLQKAVRYQFINVSQESSTTAALWKRVEKQHVYLQKLVFAGALSAAVALLRKYRIRMPALRACSGCAGDYEDPDGTTWSEDVGEDDERDESAQVEEFPERRNGASGKGGKGDAKKEK